MTEFVIYIMMENGKESDYRRKFLKNIQKNNRTLIFQPKCGLFLRYFYLPMISAKSTLRFS